MTEHRDQDVEGDATSQAEVRRGSPSGSPEPVVDDRPPEPIDPAHVAAVRRGLDELRLGRFATDQDIEAAFRRFGP